MQGCLDIASHIVADEGWGQPVKSADFFTILGERKILSSALVKSFVRLIKFRNILVHEYTRLDLEKTWQAVGQGKTLIETFCQAITAWIDKTPMD